MEPIAYRLPDTVRPERYDLALAARLDAEAFTGRVMIQCRIVRATDTIELHARDLTLAQVALTAGGRTLPGTVDLVPEAEMARIHLPEPVEAGCVSAAMQRSRDAAELAREGAHTVAMFAVDRSGGVSRFHVLEPTSLPVAAAVRGAVEACRWRPSVSEGRTVPVWVIQPFRFAPE